MRNKILISIFTIGLLAAGCSSFNTSVYRAERIAADAAVGGMKIWTTYYNEQTNGAPTPKIATLTIQANQINKVSKEVGTALAITEELRIQYGTNTTVKPMLQASLVALQNQSSNVVWLINQFVKFPTP